MIKSIPEEISKSINLLEKAEKSSEISNILPNFRKGSEQLSEYLECYPDSTYKTLIENVRQCHLRVLITNLPSLNIATFEDWLVFYLVICNQNICLEKVLKDNPSVNEIWDEFCENPLRKEAFEYLRKEHSIDMEN